MARNGPNLGPGRPGAGGPGGPRASPDFPPREISGGHACPGVPGGSRGVPIKGVKIDLIQWML